MDRSTDWQAAKKKMPLQHHFEEVVVSQDAQVLPIAKVLVEVDRQQLGRYLDNPSVR